MESERDREMVAGWKSDHKREGEDEAAKKNIDSVSEAKKGHREFNSLEKLMEDLCFEATMVRETEGEGTSKHLGLEMFKEDVNIRMKEAVSKRDAAMVTKREEARATKRDEARKRGGARKAKGKGKSKAGTKRGLKGEGKDEAVTLSAAEMYAEWKKRKEVEELDLDPEALTDPYAFEARSFEQRWSDIYGKTGYGSFEDETSIPCKIFTVHPAPCGGVTRETLQVFSVKVAELSGGLQWPLNVFGLVALRDTVDHKRNIIFEHKRDNCQTLTYENPYLILTGPVRAVVLCDYVVIEVSLYVRGTTESDDKELSLLAASFSKGSCRSTSLLIMRSYTSRLSTLDFKLGHIVCSVEATISVKVISGPPDGFYGEFLASTGSIKDEVLLHNSGGKEVHRIGDEINLSRSVVSAESHRKLTVSVSASDGYVTYTAKTDFKPLEMGTSTKKVDIGGLCQLEVTVAWSLFSYYQAIGVA